jgi:hypothetical protein
VLVERILLYYEFYSHGGFVSAAPTALEKPRLEFDFKSKTLTADGQVFEGVEGLFFGDSIYTYGGVADYSAGKAVLYIAEKVYISVEEERIDTYARVAVVRGVWKPEAKVKVAWMPGEIIIRLIQRLMRRRGVYYEVYRVEYDAATRTASFRPAGMLPLKIGGINELLFRSIVIGVGTIIQPEAAVIVPAPRDFLIVEVAGDVLIIDYGSYG